MSKLKNVISKALIGLLFVGFVYLGLKSFVVHTWQSPEVAETYAVHGADNRTLMVVFLPKNQAYFVYTQQNPEFIEFELTKVRGTYGTHYFWRLWSMEGPNIGSGLFGMRIYPSGAKPVVMETTVLDKFVLGNGSPTLGSIGDRTHPIILFSENSIEFEGMQLQREPNNPEFLLLLASKLKAQGE